MGDLPKRRRIPRVRIQPPLTTLFCRLLALVIWTIVHARNIVSSWSKFSLVERLSGVGKFEEITEEVADRSQNSDPAVEPVVHSLHFALQMVRPGRMGYSPYPKRCILLV